MTVNVDFIIIIITVAIQANFKKQFSFFWYRNYDPAAS